jgi:hypothetical protein
MSHINKTDVIFINDSEHDHWEEDNSQSTSENSVVLLLGTTSKSFHEQSLIGILDDDSDIEMIDGLATDTGSLATRPRDIIDVDSESDLYNRPPVRSQTSCSCMFWGAMSICSQDGPKKNLSHLDQQQVLALRMINT